MRVALSWADKLVEEYLLFRGFMQTHRAFLGEVKHDRLHEFQVSLFLVIEDEHGAKSRINLNAHVLRLCVCVQVDKIVEELLRLLTSFQYQ